ncbi:MAG: hypothetical protein AUG51_09080 [Acidobacteria bacterium 13_1_20CM_3_53_8]|nr:MAG: hypothetical protein AUG51_09080 [Acidobacteria bacterium 13_1_20CM_3_53_8]
MDKLVRADNIEPLSYGRPRHFFELSPNEQESFLRIRSEHLKEQEQRLYPKLSPHKSGSMKESLLLLNRRAPLLGFLSVVLIVGVFIYSYLLGSGTRIEIYLVIVIVLANLSFGLKIVSIYFERKDFQQRIKEHKELLDRYQS